MIELDHLSSGVYLDAAWEGASAKGRRLATSGSCTLLCCVIAQLVVVLLVQLIQFRLDVDLFPTTNSATTRMSVLLLHLSQDGILLDLQQIPSLRFIQSEPELANVLPIFH